MLLSVWAVHGVLVFGAGTAPRLDQVVWNIRASNWTIIQLLLGHTKLTTTDTCLNATTQLLHEVNEWPALAIVRS